MADWRSYLPAAPADAEPAAGGDDWRKYLPEKTSGAGSFLRGLAQEATFGYADELAGALESAFTSKTYRQARDESRAAYAKAEADNPTAYTAGQVTGGLASLAVPVGGIGRAATFGGKLARAAGAGAVYGAGKSEAEDLGGLAGDAATGAALAGGIYGGGALLGAGARAVWRAVAPLADSPVGELAKRAIASKAKATVAGALTGALGGDALTGAGVGLALDAAAPAVRKIAARFGKGAAAKAAAELAPAAESAGVRWEREAAAGLHAPELAPPAPRTSMPRPPVAEPAPTSPSPEPIAAPEPPAAARPAPPQPLVGRDPKSGRFVSAAKARKMGIEPEQVGVKKEAAEIPAEPAVTPEDPVITPTSQAAFRDKVQAGYQEQFRAQRTRNELKDILRTQQAGAPVVPPEDRSTTQALANIVNTQSREGAIPNLRHYPAPPDVSFKQYLAELPASAGGTPEQRRKAMGKLVLGMRNGEDPGPLIYQARAAGVKDEAIMRAVGVQPVQRTAKEAAAAAELVEPVAKAPARPRPSPAPSKPAPAPAPPEPEPEPAPVGARVVRLGAPAVPRAWNLWDLERLSREHAGDDAARDEERTFLLMYLREFAGPDGLLPVDFDGLVRDSFGELVGTR